MLWGSYKLNTKNYQLINNRIDFTSEEIVKNNPVLMVEIFQIADQQEHFISPQCSQNNS